MSNELQRQKLIIDDFLAAYPDGMGMKQNNQFLGGVADIKLASIPTGTWELEVKWWKQLPSREVELPLTPLQRQYGRRCIRAGINWGWIAIFKDGVHNFVLAGGSPETIKVDPSLGVLRPRGGGWQSYDPIKQLQRGRVS